MDKYGRARQTTDDNIMLLRKDAICIADNYNKNTDTPSEYFILNCYSTTTVVTRTRHKCYKYDACVVTYNYGVSQYIRK